jgi:hypothetical protein
MQWRYKRGNIFTVLLHLLQKVDYLVKLSRTIAVALRFDLVSR